MRSTFFLLLLALSSLSSTAQIETKTYDPNAQAAYDQALSFKNAGQHASAKASLRKALSYDQRYIAALRQLADYYFTENLLDSALYYYGQNIEFYPRDFYAHNWVVTILLQQQNYDAALSQYNNILRTFGDDRSIELQADTYYNIAKVEFRFKNNWQNAIDTGEAAMRKYLLLSELFARPTEKKIAKEKAAQARMIAAKGYFLLGNYKIALKYLKENASYFGSDPEYHFFLGNAYYQLGKTEKGAPLIKQAFTEGYEIPKELLVSGYQLPRELMLDHSEYKKND
ncbi:MAG: tetratricopeptide repeat protein [Bacteroidota bacterium]